MLKWINKKRNKKGFTLVELVVVIAILGILAAIAVPKLSSSRTSAANSAHNANVRTLESAATMLIAEKGVTEAKGTYTDTTGDMGDYIQTWPTVPKGGAADADSTYSVVIDADGTITVEPPATDLD